MKNKPLLKIYCFISNFLGTLLLIYGGVSYVALFFMHTNPAGTIRTILQLPDTVGAICFGSSCSLSAKSFVVIIGVTMVFIRILIMFGVEHFPTSRDSSFLYFFSFPLPSEF